MAKYKFRVSLSNYPDEEEAEVRTIVTEGMSEEQERETVDKEFDEWLWEQIDAGWEKKEKIKHDRS